jgi:hypothetical protein
MLLCGSLAILGCLWVAIADLSAGFIVNDYNPIRETISDLAAGQRSWILDIGLQVFAGGLAACAAGLYLWKLDGLRWKIACVLLGLVSLSIVVIARHNAYGDNVPTGIEFHVYLVYFLGIAFGVLMWLMGHGLQKVSNRWMLFSRGFALIWLVLGPLFFFVPDAWNGLYERGLGFLMLVWAGAMAYLLIVHSGVIADSESKRDSRTVPESL